MDKLVNVVRVGVQALILKNAKLLLYRRQGGFGAGSWGLPGGHLEIGESLIEAATREVFEETGIIVTNARVQAVTDPDPATNHHMQIGVLVLDWKGEPELRELTKADAFDFFDLTQLPTPIFIGSQRLIRAFTAGEFHGDGSF